MFNVEVLQLDGFTGDYKLKPEFDSVSINIGNICAYIRVADWGVSVALQSLYQELRPPLAETYLSFDEAALDEE